VRIADGLELVSHTDQLPEIQVTTLYCAKLARPLTVGVRLGPYEVVSLLGAGGMGEVYKARDTRLDRSVAIKVLSAEIAGDPDLRARFEREARAVAALDHPHICGILRCRRVERHPLHGHAVSRGRDAGRPAGAEGWV
jgi:serine/threonine protein kinase